MYCEPFLAKEGWTVEHHTTLPEKKKQTFPCDDLRLANATLQFLKASVGAIYCHQKAAIQAFLDDNQVCMTTGTASGKSLAYYVAAMETLQRHPGSTVIVIYPLKALGREQEARWRKALDQAGLKIQVGRIDGHVAIAKRLDIIKQSQVVIVTPDIIHAWLLSNLSNRAVVRVLRATRLIIVDEVHNYSGVFGSNAAMLFRRLQHLMDLLGRSTRYVCASATISEPAKHLEKLFGVPFTLIGPELDTSPRHEIRMTLVTPARQSDMLTEVSSMLKYLATKTAARFLAFVDSRKQAEQLSSIVARTIKQCKDEEDEESYASFDDLEKFDVLPFRAGYEERDRNLIQDRLSCGSLRGVVSTSALELGIDIPYLDTAVLVGVPNSLTSLYQRIGRIGRHKQGEVIIINTGSVYDEAVFREPQRLLSRPLAESALYLENTRLQYIHALCLARPEGEHDQVASTQGGTDFITTVSWPAGFIDVCQKERTGEISTDLQAMKAECGDDPNHVFPLRDIESQYKVELRQGPEQAMMGSLSQAQLMREAYPGAVYYYATQPFRVYKVLQPSKTVLVRREKRYTTKPQIPPTLIFPNLTQGNIHFARRYGDLIVIECNLQVRQTVTGYKERRGSNEFVVPYPMQAGGVTFDLPRFTKNVFTTGVLLTHPSLAGKNVRYDALAELVYEAFVMAIPFERQDINFAADKHRVARGVIVQGAPFLAVYDQTYGSLRLSGRLREYDSLDTVLHSCVDLVGNQEGLKDAPETMGAITQMLSCLEQPPVPLKLEEAEANDSNSSAQRVRVILPGSRGLSVSHANEEFIVAKVMFHPTVNGLAYRGRYQSNTAEGVADIVPLSELVEIPGESRIGYYDYDLGETVSE